MLFLVVSPAAMATSSVLTRNEGKIIRIDGAAVAKAVREGVKAEITILTSSGVVAKHGMT